MFHFLIFTLLLVYFWYFYHASPNPVPPPSTSRPLDPLPFPLQFERTQPDTFRFSLHGVPVWEHVLQDPAYLVTLDRITSKDVCYPHDLPTHVPATGWSLYQYVKAHPEFEAQITFRDNAPYAPQDGTAFYFTCHHRRIVRLDPCPSGTYFLHSKCVLIEQCTGQPDGLLLSSPSDATQYYKCRQGLTTVHTCPRGTFFYHDRCVRRQQLTYYCKLHDTPAPLKLDHWTLFECREGVGTYISCPPGTQLFDRPVCEPNLCVGQPDDAKLPLAQETRGPFQWVPGYQECVHEKVSRTVECDATWNPQESHGDNLLHLPQVFHQGTCTVPVFCENVWPNDPQILVPVHEFTKNVQNWPLSERYDRLAGYKCTPGGRQRQVLPPGERISKQYKAESACDGPHRLPIADEPTLYYDCGAADAQVCDLGEFFNGETCRPIPTHAFHYRKLPLFQMNGLDAHGWMRPWESLPAGYVPLTACPQATDVLMKGYDLCADPACVPFSFLSLLPDVSLLLPRAYQAKCQYDSNERRLSQVPVQHPYTFWDQQLEGGNEKCTFGQHPKTGHAIWDRTLFATCDEREPFVFCPSPITDRLLRDGTVYACAPPVDQFLLHEAHTRVLYVDNEIHRLLPPVWDGVPYHYQLNFAQPPQQTLPRDGWVVPKGTRVNLISERPLHLELHYRVTHPTHVAFEYTPQYRLRSAPLGHHFHVRSEDFVQRLLRIPIYSPKAVVPDLKVPYHP